MAAPDHTEAWLPIKEAAELLGLSEKALRSRLVRRTLRSRRGNDGRVQVLIQDAPVKHAPEIHRAISGADQTEARQSAERAIETVPLFLHRETVEAIQRASSEALAAAGTRHREQIDQLRSDIAQERVETARRSADRDSLHLDTLNRLQAQAASEQSLWLERIDAAECRAERLEQRLDQVLDQLLADRRRPWWRRWFG